MSRRVSKNLNEVALFLLCCGGLTACLYTFFANPLNETSLMQRRVEALRPVSQPAEADGLTALLARSWVSADARNQAALTFCMSEINAIIDREFTGLYFTAEEAAKEAATYTNCVRLIAILASDSVRGRSDAHDWVRRKIDSRLAPRITACNRDIQASVERFDRELAASTLRMATEVAAIGATGREGSVPGSTTEELEKLSLNAALKKLGYHGAILTPVIAIDVYTLLHTRIAQWLITKIIDLGKWIFARPMAAAAAEVTLVAADGPLPIGDIIALVGAAWTAYDIYSLRHKFETELTTSIRDSLPEARKAIHREVSEGLRKRVVSHAELQARIHDETAKLLLP